MFIPPGGTPIERSAVMGPQKKGKKKKENYGTVQDNQKKKKSDRPENNVKDLNPVPEKRCLQEGRAAEWGKLFQKETKKNPTSHKKKGYMFSRKVKSFDFVQDKQPRGGVNPQKGPQDRGGCLKKPDQKKR